MSYPQPSAQPPSGRFSPSIEGAERGTGVDGAGWAAQPVEGASNDSNDFVLDPATAAPSGEGNELVDLSRSILDALQRRLQPEQFATWFRRVNLVRLDSQAAVFAVPNDFAREWIGSYYLEPMGQAIFATLGLRRRVELRVDPEASVSAVDAPEEPGAPHVAPGSAPRSGDGVFERDAGMGGESTAVGIEERLSGAPRREGPNGNALAGNPLLNGRHAGRVPIGPGATHPEMMPGVAPGSEEALLAGSQNTDTMGRTAGPAEPPATDWPAVDDAQPSPTGPNGMDAATLHAHSDIVLNPRYTFEHYVVGPCNRFAHAAAMGSAEHPGRAYNPLFLHGRVGVGKTHLLQALCFMILERQPGARILYLSCETFVNHFINALENGDLMEFRDKYRNVDVLVVDDIQLLANKERTQEEFFHTFNALYNAGKQIVLSSDSPPKDIPTLQDRLVSRFKWGMVTEVSSPCFETRVAIVKRKGRDRGHEVPDEVAQFIAEHIEENVRELEGAVTRLLGYAAITAQSIDVEMARNALSDLIDVQRGAPTMDDIIGVVTSHYSVKLSDLQSKRRTAAIAFPRQVAMFLARRITRHSLEEIGGFFGGRDHTTVLYAVDKISKLCEKDADSAKQIGSLLEKLTGRRL